MTSVVSVKTNIKNTTLAIGQLWTNKAGVEYLITNLVLMPDMDALGNNSQVTLMAHGDVIKGSITEFLSSDWTLTNDIKIDEQPGLHGHHLLEPYNSIAVGQRWRHHKGDVYVITSVALEANVGIDDFNLARISYRALEAGKTHEWNLTVGEFLKHTDSGTKRFTPVLMEGKLKRNVMQDKSLRYLWRISI